VNVCKEPIGDLYHRVEFTIGVPLLCIRLRYVDTPILIALGDAAMQSQAREAALTLYKVLLMNNATTSLVWAALPALKVKAKYTVFGIRKLICVTPAAAPGAAPA
jgi:hypothetical protein